MSEPALPTQMQAGLVIHYVEGWISDAYPEAAKYLRGHVEEMAEQMVDDECARENPEHHVAVESLVDWICGEIRLGLQGLRPADFYHFVTHLALTIKAAEKMARGELAVPEPWTYGDARKPSWWKLCEAVNDAGQRCLERKEIWPHKHVYVDVELTASAVLPE